MQDKRCLLSPYHTQDFPKWLYWTSYLRKISSPRDFSLFKRQLLLISVYFLMRLYAVSKQFFLLLWLPQTAAANHNTHPKRHSLARTHTPQPLPYTHTPATHSRSNQSQAPSWHCCLLLKVSAGYALCLSTRSWFPFAFPGDGGVCCCRLLVGPSPHSPAGSRQQLFT